MMAAAAAMSMTVFLPSLPAMTAYFGTDYAIMQLSVSLYLAVTGALQLVIGPLSDRYGRRPVMLAALSIFLVATLGCLLAPNVTVFLICRMVQGVIVVGIVLSRAVVRDMVPEAQAASMIGYVTMGMALVPMVAPMVGGALEQVFGWHAVFGFLFFSGAAVLALVWADQGETAASAGRPLSEQIREYPILLLSPRFWGYALSAAFVSATFFAFLGGAPYAASEVYGMSPVWTGIAFSAPALGYAAGNGLSGRFSARLGVNRMMLIGACIVTGGTGLSVALSLGGLSHPAVFFTAMATVGIGNGMVVPNATAGLLSVRPSVAGTASGLGGAVMIGGGAAVSVLAGLVMEGASSSLPLQVLMLSAAIISLMCTLFVIARTAQVSQVEPA